MVVRRGTDDADAGVEFGLGSGLHAHRAFFSREGVAAGQASAEGCRRSGTQEGLSPVLLLEFALPRDFTWPSSARAEALHPAGRCSAGVAP